MTRKFIAICKHHNWKLLFLSPPPGLLLILIILFLFGPIIFRFPSDVPKDRDLMASFWEHHETFKMLGSMALMDSENASYISLNTLPDKKLKAGRSDQYIRLLKQIKGINSIAVQYDSRVLFFYGGGGILLAVGPSWSKCIAYFPNGLTSETTVVNDLD